MTGLKLDPISRPVAIGKSGFLTHRGLVREGAQGQKPRGEEPSRSLGVGVLGASCSCRVGVCAHVSLCLCLSVSDPDGFPICIHFTALLLAKHGMPTPGHSAPSLCPLNLPEN